MLDTLANGAQDAVPVVSPPNQNACDQSGPQQCLEQGYPLRELMHGLADLVD